MRSFRPQDKLAQLAEHSEDNCVITGCHILASQGGSMSRHLQANAGEPKQRRSRDSVAVFVLTPPTGLRPVIPSATEKCRPKGGSDGEICRFCFAKCGRSDRKTNSLFDTSLRVANVLLQGVTGHLVPASALDSVVSLWYNSGEIKSRAGKIALTT